MQLTPYLMFNGQCEAAFKFYEQCLGGKIITMMTYGQMPAAEAEQVSQESHKQIAHVRLQVGEAVLMGSDCSPERFEAAKVTDLLAAYKNAKR